jgi:hypothetical protein
MKKFALASTLALAFAGTAFANPDGKKEMKPAEKAAPAAPVKAEAPPAMEMKPAAELEQLKGMIGSWKCSGKVTAMGQEMASESTSKSAWDLDNYWVVTNMAEKKKGKGKEPAYKAHDLTGYDAGAKMFVRMSVDNMGTSSTSTSKGWEGDKMEWAGNAKMMGKDVKLVETITKDATGKQITIAGHYLAGADKPVAWNLTCKK